MTGWRWRNADLRTRNLWPNTLRRQHATWLPDTGVAKPTRHVSADLDAVEIRSQLITAHGHVTRRDTA